MAKAFLSETDNRFDITDDPRVNPYISADPELIIEEGYAPKSRKRVRQVTDSLRALGIISDASRVTQLYAPLGTAPRELGPVAQVFLYNEPWAAEYDMVVFPRSTLEPLHALSLNGHEMQRSVKRNREVKYKVDPTTFYAVQLTHDCAETQKIRQERMYLGSRLIATHRRSDRTDFDYNKHEQLDNMLLFKVPEAFVEEIARRSSDWFDMLGQEPVSMPIKKLA